ncbi:MAG TPA: 4-(cytidine 5'-diphospho)-2-C-methyl-D-erythritol kinase, partial [Burkholderiaceae bacterium]
GPALAEGIGERLSPRAAPARWYALIHPQVHVSTAEIFKSAALTAHLKQARIQGFSEGGRRDKRTADAPWSGEPGSGNDGGNDLEPIVRHRVPEVDAALRYLAGFGESRMTGSGASVFAAFETEAQAQRAIAGAPAGCSSWVVCGLSEHPLASW